MRANGLMRRLKEMGFVKEAEKAGYRVVLRKEWVELRGDGYTYGFTKRLAEAYLKDGKLNELMAQIAIAEEG